MPTKPGWTDIDFIGAYNAANSTDWKTSLAWFLWVPSAGKYWIAVDMFAGDGVTESPGSWAIIDPITRSIEGFSDESGFTHTTIDGIAYSESDGCVWTRGRNSLFVGFYYTKYASDGSVLVQSPSVQGSLTHITASPVTGQLYGWQNNSPSPGYQIKTVDGTTGELGSAVITSSDPIAVTFVFDGAGDVWYRTNSGPTSAKVWRYDVAGATSYEALSVSGTTDLPYLWLYNSRDDTILLSYPSGSPKKIKWINVSDYSVAETVEFGSDWSNSIRSFDEFDTYRGKVWCWISAYYGLITIEAYALVDPADWDAEPEYYEWGAYGGGYAVTNGYQHEVCVDAAVYDPAEIYYTRIWPGSVASRRWVNVNINMRRR